MGRVEMIIQDAPLMLMRAVNEDAERRNVSRNEAIVSILAERFGCAHTPQVDSFRGVPLLRTFVVRMSGELRGAIRVYAATTSSTMRGVVLQALAQYYDLPFVSPQRRRRTVRQSSIPKERTG